jgi:hypothetical protein
MASPSLAPGFFLLISGQIRDFLFPNGQILPIKSYYSRAGKQLAHPRNHPERE